MPGHQAVEEWMGREYLTLADLLAHRLKAVCVGINPAPDSVSIGHYYQGKAGQRFFTRLQKAGVLPGTFESFEDDAAFARGVGFTDIVKRPTPRAKDVRSDELAHGGVELARKVHEYKPRLVVFTFKGAAEAVFGKFVGNGFMTHPLLPNTDIFVMPGPYESNETAEPTLAKLREYVRGQQG
jgi:double-stranded uracil-DNA glycosylase